MGIDRKYAGQMDDEHHASGSSSREAAQSLMSEAAQIENDADAQYAAGNITHRKYLKEQRKAHNKRIKASRIGGSSGNTGNSFGDYGIGGATPSGNL